MKEVIKFLDLRESSQLVNTPMTITMLDTQAGWKYYEERKSLVGCADHSTHFGHWKLDILMMI